MKTVKEPPVSDVTPKSVPDPDLEIRRGEGGGGGGNPHPEIRGRSPVSKIFFRPFGPQFGLKIRGGGAPQKTDLTGWFVVFLQHVQPATQL